MFKKGSLKNFNNELNKYPRSMIWFKWYMVTAICGNSIMCIFATIIYPTTYQMSFSMGLGITLNLIYSLLGILALSNIIQIKPQGYYLLIATIYFTYISDAIFNTETLTEMVLELFIIAPIFCILNHIYFHKRKSFFFYGLEKCTTSYTHGVKLKEQNLCCSICKEPIYYNQEDLLICKSCNQAYHRECLERRGKICHFCSGIQFSRVIPKKESIPNTINEKVGINDTVKQSTSNSDNINKHIILLKILNVYDDLSQKLYKITEDKIGNNNNLIDAKFITSIIANELILKNYLCETDLEYIENRYFNTISRNEYLLFNKYKETLIPVITDRNKLVKKIFNYLYYSYPRILNNELIFKEFEIRFTDEYLMDMLKFKNEFKFYIKSFETQNTTDDNSIFLSQEPEDSEISYEEETNKEKIPDTSISSDKKTNFIKKKKYLLIIGLILLLVIPPVSVNIINSNKVKHAEEIIMLMEDVKDCKIEIINNEAYIYVKPYANHRFSQNDLDYMWNTVSYENILFLKNIYVVNK